MAYLGLYPRRMAAGGPVTKYFLDRATFPADYGNRLRAAGLNEGEAWGGSELSPREDISPDQIAKALALAAPDLSPAIPNAPTFGPADYARFLAQQNGGPLPGLPNIGGDEGVVGGRDTTPPEETGIPGTTGVGGTGSISNLGDLPEATEMSPPSMFDMSNLTGQQAFDAGLTALGLGFSAAAMNPLGLVSNLRDAGRIGKSISET